MSQTRATKPSAILVASRKLARARSELVQAGSGISTSIAEQDIRSSQGWSWPVQSSVRHALPWRGQSAVGEWKLCAKFLCAHGKQVHPPYVWQRTVAGEP